MNFPVFIFWEEVWKLLSCGIKLSQNFQNIFIRANKERHFRPNKNIAANLIIMILLIICKMMYKCNDHANKMASVGRWCTSPNCHIALYCMALHGIVWYSMIFHDPYMHWYCIKWSCVTGMTQELERLKIWKS